jgi:hypothetical protein
VMGDGGLFGPQRKNRIDPRSQAHVRTRLVIEVAIEIVTVEDRKKPAPRQFHDAHDCPAARTLAMTAATRCHCVRSFLMRRLPAVVIE